MAVVANISVLLAAKVENYRSGMAFAKQENASFARSAKSAGLSTRAAGQAIDQLRKEYVASLPAISQYMQEAKAIEHLHQSGVLRVQDYERAMRNLDATYKQNQALEAAASQEKFNRSIERGLQLLNPQINAQRKAKEEYRRTIESLNNLERNGRAQRLGISPDAISDARRQAFLNAQASFQGKPSPVEEAKRQQKILEKVNADARQTAEAYNAAVKRGADLARPASAALEKYRADLKDVSKALFQGKIDQEEFNRAKLTLQRQRLDTSLDPILRAGRDQAAPYIKASNDIIRQIENMRAAVKAGVISQQEMNQVATRGAGPLNQLAAANRVFANAVQQGTLEQKELAIATRLAKQEFFGQQTALQKLTKGLGVFKTVGIGLASAQLYNAVFQGFSDGFEFEPQIRRAIALFGELDDATRRALRDSVISSTDNNVGLVERARVLQELAKDGVDAETAIRSLNQTLDFASVADLGAQDAVSRVSEVMKAYRLETGNAIRDTETLRQTMDLLVASANQTASDVSQMAEALIRTAPQANQLEIGLREAAAGAIALSEIGRKGEVGGNELAIALRDLTNKAIENRKAFEAIGVEVFDSQGEFASMALTIRSLSNAFEGLSSEERTLQLQQLGVTQKASQFQQQLTSLVNVIEEAEVSFEQTNGAVQRLKDDSLTELEIATNKLNTAYSQLVNDSVVFFFENLSYVMNNTSSETLGIVAGLTTFSFTLGATLEYSTRFIAFLKQMRDAYQKMGVAQAFITALSGPKGIAAVIAAGAAATSVGYLTYRAFESLEKGFNNAGAAADETTKKIRQLRDALGGTEDIAKYRKDVNSVFDDIKASFEEQKLYERNFTDAFLQTAFALYTSNEADDVFSPFAKYIEDAPADAVNGIKNRLTLQIKNQIKALQDIVSQADSSTIDNVVDNLTKLNAEIRAFNEYDPLNSAALESQYERIIALTKEASQTVRTFDNLLRQSRDKEVSIASSIVNQLEAFQTIQQQTDFGNILDLNVSGNLSDLISRLQAFDANSLEEDKLKAYQEQLASLRDAYAEYLTQTPDENSILGTMDLLIDKAEELYSTIGNEEQADLFERQRRALESVFSELDTPIDSVIRRLQELEVLKIELQPEIERRYIESLLKDIDSEVGGEFQVNKLNQAQLIRGAVDEYNARNSVFSNSSEQRLQKRHSEIIRRLDLNNTNLAGIIRQLQAIAEEQAEDTGTDPFGGF